MPSHKELHKSNYFAQKQIEDSQRKIGINPLIIRKFFSRVSESKNGCWEWIGGINSSGYGCFKFQEKQQLTHRLSYSWFVGPIECGKLICHLCNNKKCVNPHHLYLGTQFENMRDAVKDGLIEVGEKSSSSKLKYKDVVSIKKEYKNSNLTQYELAKKYKTVQTNIHMIVSGKTWKNV